jgi:hypothetical protein
MHARRHLLTSLAVPLALMATAAVARADDDTCAADAAPAKCYLAKAQVLRESQPAQAAALYLKSYRLDPKIDPLAGYGFALALDNQYANAADVLEKAAEEYDKIRAKLEKDNSDANTLFQVIHRVEFVRDEINKLVPKLGKVQIKVANKQLPPGITVVRKNGSDLRGSDPTLFYVNPNSDTLVFTYASGKTLDFEVNVPAGTISSIDVPPEPVPPPPPPPPPPPVPDPSGTNRTLAYVTGGIGAAVLVGGIGYIAFADSANAGVTAGIMSLGLVGVAGGIYFYFRADKQHKAWLEKQHPSPADKPGQPPAKPTNEDETEEGEAMLLPFVGEHSIGAGFVGSF